MATLERLDTVGHNVGLIPFKLTLVAADFADGSEVDLGLDLPSEGMIVRAWSEVITAETTATTKTVSIGTLSTDSGDADGIDATVDGGAAAGTKVVADGALISTLIENGSRQLSATFGDAGGANELEMAVYIWVACEPDSAAWNAVG